MSTHPFSLNSVQAIGIPIALLGAGFLAVGSQLQQQGVLAVENEHGEGVGSGLGVRQIVALAHRPAWLIGTALTVLAIICQLISLFLAPLTLVQPIGAAALFFTAGLSARVTKKRLGAAAIRAMLLAAGGVALFVVVAAVTTTTVPVDPTQLIVVLIIVVAVTAALGLAFVVTRQRANRIFFVIGGGVCFGFVATIAKVLLVRIQQIFQHGFDFSVEDWLTIFCLLALIATGLLGTYFVQTAYSGGAPEVVVAGLTVIDPIVGVTIGIVVLHEAAGAPWWTAIVFPLAGIAAVIGVFRLSRARPDLTQAAGSPKRESVDEPHAESSGKPTEAENADER